MRKPDSFIPTIAGTQLAMKQWDHPGMYAYALQRYEVSLGDHYSEHGESKGIEAGQKQRAMKILRHMIRVTSAPVIFGIERRLAHAIYAAQRDRRLLLPSDEYLPDTTYASPLRLSEVPYTEEQRIFLRACTVLTSSAAQQFIKEANHESHWCYPALQAFHRVDRDAAYLPFTRQYPLHSQAEQRLVNHVVAANVTALNLLVPTLKHMRAFPGHDFLGNTHALSWAATTFTGFFERYFPDQQPGQTLPCPYRHDTDRLSRVGGMWAVDSLVNGPWPVPAYCPATIVLGQACETAAELRLESAIAIGQEVLGDIRRLIP